MTPIVPSATIGILGGGQLGRMLSFEAQRMGYRVCVFDPTEDCPAAQTADFHIRAPFWDLQAVRKFVSLVDVATVETEHLPIDLLAQIERQKPLHPSSRVLETIQDRWTQKVFLSNHNIPQMPFAPVTDAKTLMSAVEQIGLPAILKTRRTGYDGKGQARIEHKSRVEEAWSSIGSAPSVLEAVALFEKEISVLLARNTKGEVCFYEVAENVHRHHVLHSTFAPARISEEVKRRARELAQSIASQLQHVGMMAIEMFLMPDSSLCVNEIAPRVHNSGHYTFGACVTSQFEQHVRAVCGLPPGDVSLLRPAVMVNLMGDLWQKGKPQWETIFREAEVKVHLYGKADARAKRKMGHLLLLNEDVDSSLRLLDKLVDGLDG